MMVTGDEGEACMNSMVNCLLFSESASERAAFGLSPFPDIFDFRTSQVPANSIELMSE